MWGAVINGEFRVEFTGTPGEVATAVRGTVLGGTTVAGIIAGVGDQGRSGSSFLEGGGQGLSSRGIGTWSRVIHAGPERSACGAGHDVAGDLGDPSVAGTNQARPETGRVANRDGVLLSGSSGMPRGPNYERNQAARMRKKIQKEERRLAEAEARGREAGRREGGLPRARAAVVERTKDEQRLHELKVRRQIIQEERKLNKLQSPEQIIEDAMRHVAFAQKCAKMSNDSKVAGWAATVLTASSESVARSAPSSIPSVGSVAGAKKAAVKKEQSLSIAKLAPNAVEEAALKSKVYSQEGLVAARRRVGRALDRDDFYGKDAPMTNMSQKADIEEAAYFSSKYKIDFYDPY